MIIPYLNYEISFLVSNKTYFCIFLMLLYLIVANPGTYKIVGNSVGLEKYDDFRSHDRHYLLFVHAIVFAFVVYIALSIYNPFTNIPKMIHKSKILHKPKLPQK